MNRSIYQARARLEVWLADRGCSTGPVAFDAHLDDDAVVVYASVYGGGTAISFSLPPAWTYDRESVEQLFAIGKNRFFDFRFGG